MFKENDEDSQTHRYEKEPVLRHFVNHASHNFTPFPANKAFEFPLFFEKCQYDPKTSSSQNLSIGAQKARTPR